MKHCILPINCFTLQLNGLYHMVLWVITYGFITIVLMCTYTVADKKSSRFFSVQRNATEGKRQRNGNATESLTFRSCNSLEPQMLYLVFNSTFPSLPPGAKTLRTSNSYLVLLFSYIAGGKCMRNSSSQYAAPIPHS